MSVLIRRGIWLIVLMLSVNSASASLFGMGGTQEKFLPVEQAFQLNVEPQADGSTNVSWEITPGYYLYKNRLRFDGLSELHKPELPTGEPHSDEFFGDQEVYRQFVQVNVPAGAEETVTLGWQGCADAGLCYPPQTQDVVLSSMATKNVGQATDQSLASNLSEKTLISSLLVFFGLGLLLAFTPCTLPMLPILAGVVIGKGRSMGRSVLLASVYVVSMALVYAALGVLAAVMGANLQAVLQQPWVVGSFAALFVVLALPMFGFFELQLPSFLRDRLENAGRQQQGGSVLGASILGLLSGLLVGPCMTAPLAAALLFIAQSGDVLQGGLVLFSLGLGMGLPLLLLVTVGNGLLPKPGPWMDSVKGVFGFLFLAAAVFVIRAMVSESLWLGLWGAWGLLLAVAMLMTGQRAQRGRITLTGLGTLLGVWSVIYLVGAASGSRDWQQPLQGLQSGVAVNVSSAESPVLETVRTPAQLDRVLANAKANQQWLLLDYYADWCVSCKVMERTVFEQPEVQAALANIQIVRLDVTESNADSKALLQRYQVPGPPTFIWVGPNGEERRAQRITGEVNAAEFLTILQEVTR